MENFGEKMYQEMKKGSKEAKGMVSQAINLLSREMENASEVKNAKREVDREAAAKEQGGTAARTGKPDVRAAAAKSIGI